MTSVLPQRKNLRFKGYDYSQSGWYYVTICTKNNINYFGSIQNKIMRLNKFGNIVSNQWLWLKEQYNYINLDEWIIMPNHIHAILVIKNHTISASSVRTGRDLSVQNPKIQETKYKSLSSLIGAFKTTSSKALHQAGLSEFIWHRSYYDHIIRNEEDYKRIIDYIRNNPRNWAEDELNNEEQPTL